jgi:ankyrin repeat protein
VLLCGITLARSQNGFTALICAAENGHADCARLLLDAGADKEVKNLVRASAGVLYGP